MICLDPLPAGEQAGLCRDLPAIIALQVAVTQEHRSARCTCQQRIDMSQHQFLQQATGVHGVMTNAAALLSSASAAAAKQKPQVKTHGIMLACVQTSVRPARTSKCSRSHRLALSWPKSVHQH
jgi:hypothetical protein